jgi:RNA polymerase sigma-70 factor (ECF subfamily)
MPAPPLSPTLVARLHARASADRWGLPHEAFAAALAATAAKLVGDESCDERECERRLTALHLEDLALACACSLGHEAAWEHFIRNCRPALYRAADALDPTGSAREIADSLYADLYGTTGKDGTRRSLFRYFHGRSSLATWLRAVLAQRHVDRVRSARRLEPLPDEEGKIPPPPGNERADPDPERPRFQRLISQALARVVARLDPRDRLRLGCYYGQGLTLAETGRVLGEHEATASRNLARTRKAIRTGVEAHLRDAAGLNDAQVAHAFEVAAEDGRAMDLSNVLEPDASRSGPDRSTSERTSG